MLRATPPPGRAEAGYAPLAVCVGVSIAAGVASARTMEPGNIVVGGGVGPSFKTGSELGMSSGYLMLNGLGEYVFTPEISGVASVAAGLAGTIPLRVRLGGRYRIIGGQLPLSPYVQLEASVSRLYDVLGTNLTSYGLRAGGGADYFLSANWMVGILGAWALARTTGERPASYSTIDGLLTFGHVF
jgi:hypothetical protein